MPEVESHHADIGRFTLFILLIAGGAVGFVAAGAALLLGAAASTAFALYALPALTGLAVAVGWNALRHPPRKHHQAFARGVNNK